MIKINRDQLLVVDNYGYVKSHPEIFLPNGKADPIKLAGEVAETALILGASKVQIKRVNAWLMISSDRDWMQDDEQDAFNTLLPFPEAGDNSCRPEFIIAAFGKGLIFKSQKKQPRILKSDDEVKSILTVIASTDWDATFAFKI